MADQSTIDKLFKQLDHKHPEYEIWRHEWQRYRDVLGDEIVDKETYLPKNKFEPQDQYEFRVQMSQFIPESGLAVERLIGALYREKPKREYGANEAELKEFLDAANRKRESWDSVVEEIAHVLIGYGTTRVLVTNPPASIGEGSPIAAKTAEGETVAPTQGLTRAQEKELGIRPYVVNYKPLSVIDWETDENDVLVFVRIKEHRTVRDPMKPRQGHKKAVRFIEYTQTSVEWWDFLEDEKGKDRKLTDHQQREHGLGMVPMVMENLRDVKPGIGHSFIRYSSRADVRKFQAESDQAYDTYLHAHPFLAIWTEDELKEIGLGTNTYLKLNPGGAGGEREDAKYIDAPSSAFEALTQTIDAARAQIFRQAQVDPMGVIQSQGASSTFQASGVSRAWSFGTSEARILTKIANRMEQVEKAVFELVLRMQTRREVKPDAQLFKGSVAYPEEFDLASTAQLLEESSQIGSMVNSPTLLKTLHKRIAASKVGDVPAKILKDIQKEIEDNPLIGTSVGRMMMDGMAAPGATPGAAGVPPKPGGPPKPGAPGQQNQPAQKAAPPKGKSPGEAGSKQKQPPTPGQVRSKDS